MLQLFQMSAFNTLFVFSTIFFLGLSIQNSKILRTQPDKQADLYYVEGKLFYQKDKFQETSQAYFKAISLNSNNKQAFLQLGTALFQLQRYDQAQDALEKAIAIDKFCTQCHNGLGNVHALKRQFQKAKNCYHIAIGLRQNFPNPYNGLGYVYESQGHIQKGVKYYKQSLQVDPKYYKAYNNLGRALQTSQNYEQALVCYKKAIQIKFNDFVALKNLATLYDYLGRQNQAIAIYQTMITLKGIKINDYNFIWFLQIAELYQRKRDYRKAFETYAIMNQGQAHKKYNDTRWYYKMRQMLYKQKVKDEAVRLYTKTVLNQSSLAKNSQNNDIETNFQHLIDEESIKNFEKAVEFDKQFSKVYGLYFNSICIDCQTVQTMKKQYLQQEHIQIDYCQIYNQIGKNFLNQQKFSQAKAYFQLSAKVNSSNCKPFQNLARMYKKQGQFQISQNYYEQAIQLSNSQYPLIYIQLAQLLIILERYEEAKLILFSTIQIDRYQIQAYQNMIQIQIFLKDFQHNQTIALLLKTLKSRPQKLEAVDNLKICQNIKNASLYLEYQIPYAYQNIVEQWKELVKMQEESTLIIQGMNLNKQKYDRQVMLDIVKQ